VRNPALWENRILDNINLTGKDLIFNFYSLSAPFLLRRYLFYDGYGRIIDPRFYKKNSLKICLQYGYQDLWIREHKIRTIFNKRKRHCKTDYRGKFIQTWRTRKLNAIPEYKKFGKISRQRIA